MPPGGAPLEIKNILAFAIACSKIKKAPFDNKYVLWNALWWEELCCMWRENVGREEWMRNGARLGRVGVGENDKTIWGGGWGLRGGTHLVAIRSQRAYKQPLCDVHRDTIVGMDKRDETRAPCGGNGGDKRRLLVDHENHKLSNYPTQCVRNCNLLG